MRWVLVDTSVLITLADIGRLDCLYGIDETPVVPEAVREEITSEPASSEVTEAIHDTGNLRIDGEDHRYRSHWSSFQTAASHLGESFPDEPAGCWVGGGVHWSGDVALLARAIEADDAVVVTDDKPLRETCKALSVPISGSIGVIIAAVERGDLDAEEAKDALVAMDEVGAHLSARLLRRAERMIDEVTGETD